MGARMFECQAICMEKTPSQADGLAQFAVERKIPVNPVADDGMMSVGGLHPDLVGSSGQ